MEQVIAPAKHAASWPAIFAGAVVAVSITLILVALGPGHGIASASLAVTTAIWLVVTQWIAAALGGYISGRLRTRWMGTHEHEIFFRDTAHGLITWSVATMALAVVAAAAAVSAAGTQGANTYSIDKLFRSGGSGVSSAAVVGSTDPRLETAHIVANAEKTGRVPDADRSYLVEQVAARSGVPMPEARSRVDAFFSDADAGRRAVARASIYLALSMLVGAFIASVSAVLGGRLRDEHP